MHWDELLARLEEAGHAPQELDFMDDYGPIARRTLPALDQRRWRCLYGVARIHGDLRFEAYLFPSLDDAEDFHQLMAPVEIWFRVDNVVLRAEPEHVPALRTILRNLGKTAGDG